MTDSSVTHSSATDPRATDPRATDPRSTTVYRARVMDTPQDPFAVGGSALRVESDAAVVVDEATGKILWRGPFGEGRPAYPDAPVVDLREGVLLPGLVDTHVHYPQIRAIGGLGMPLLDWLDKVALPEEVRLGDRDYARDVAREFLHGLRRAGTTTALVFGSHFASAVDVLLSEAADSGQRITAGQVLSDRLLHEPLHTDPATAVAEGRELVERWHGAAGGRLRYAVTPRFSLSCSEPMLEACAELLGQADDLFCTSHLNENLAEIDTVAELFPGSSSYLDTYDRAGLLGPRTVMAHNVHPTDAELARMAETGTSAAHCPTSNATLGSGSFPLRRHVEAGVTVALGCDVGAGSGFSLLKEGLQAYFCQQLLADDGYPLGSAHLLHLATTAGATALGLQDTVGHLSVGMDFDAVWLRPEPRGTLETGLHYARDDQDALAKLFVLGTPHDVAGVWVAGHRLT